MVDLPLPVGPVTRMIPLGARIPSSKRLRISSAKPRSLRFSDTLRVSRMRITVFSPRAVGKVLIRRSILRPSSITWTRPSWGSRRSLMSSAAMILMRLMIAL